MRTASEQGAEQRAYPDHETGQQRSDGRRERRERDEAGDQKSRYSAADDPESLGGADPAEAAREMAGDDDQRDPTDDRAGEHAATSERIPQHGAGDRAGSTKQYFEPEEFRERPVHAPSDSRGMRAWASTFSSTRPR